MASASLEWGPWGFALSGDQGQSPWSGGQGASPAKAKRIFIINGRVL